ncbi:MAG TPA: DUF2752 domain-containing protein [Ignavibacteriaceae bacterium]|nr:DUF2752 domain-containing protein [Ignavibacteriaceae bacterium]
MKNYFLRFFRIVNPEALIWISGILLLAFINVGNSSHFTVCPFRNLGIDFCPGCGLGKSIHYFLHLQIEQSLNAHPLGIVAFAVLVRRIYELLRNSFNNQKTFFSPKMEYKYDQSFTTNA